MPAPKPSPNPSQPLVQAEAAGRCRPAALQLGLPAPVKRPRVPSIFTKQPIEVRHECASVHRPFYSSARFFWPPSLFCSRGEHRGHFSASASAARRSRQMGGGSAGARQLPKTQHSHLSRAPLRAESLAPLHRCVLQLRCEGSIVPGARQRPRQLVARGVCTVSAATTLSCKNCCQHISSPRCLRPGCVLWCWLFAAKPQMREGRESSCLKVDLLPSCRRKMRHAGGDGELVFQQQQWRKPKWIFSTKRQGNCHGTHPASCPPSGATPCADAVSPAPGAGGSLEAPPAPPATRIWGGTPQKAPSLLPGRCCLAQALPFPQARSHLLLLRRAEDCKALTHTVGRTMGKCSGADINQGAGQRGPGRVRFFQRTSVEERSKEAVN